jgi:hypothetical protein
LQHCGLSLTKTREKKKKKKKYLFIPIAFPRTPQLWIIFARKPCNFPDTPIIQISFLQILCPKWSVSNTERIQSFVEEMNLDSLSLSCIFGNLDAASLSRLSCVCSGLRNAVASDSRCWARLCGQDFGVEKGDHTIYLQEAREFGRYRKHGFASLRRSFAVLAEAFRAAGFGEIFCAGVTEAMIDEKERSLGSLIPLSLRASLRIVNGQRGQTLKESGLGQ